MHVKIQWDVIKVRVMITPSISNSNSPIQPLGIWIKTSNLENLISIKVGDMLIFWSRVQLWTFMTIAKIDIYAHFSLDILSLTTSNQKRSKFLTPFMDKYI